MWTPCVPAGSRDAATHAMFELSCAGPAPQIDQSSRRLLSAQEGPLAVVGRSREVVSPVRSHIPSTLFSSISFAVFQPKVLVCLRIAIRLVIAACGLLVLFLSRFDQKLISGHMNGHMQVHVCGRLQVRTELL